MSEKLKPCPFCGGKGKIEDTIDKKYCYVFCVDCDVSTSPVRMSICIKDWNRRVKE